jgi:hypothetical protein
LDLDIVNSLLAGGRGRRPTTNIKPSISGDGLLGVGIGMTMQNLVLSVQNTVAASDLGAASSVVAFFRSLGGTIGVSVLGAVLSSHVTDLISQGLAGTPYAAAASSGSGSVGLADFADAPPALQALIRVSYGDATGRIFLISSIVAVVAVLAVALIREVPLRTQSGEQRLQSEATPADDVDAELAALEAEVAGVLPARA